MNTTNFHEQSICFRFLVVDDVHPVLFDLLRPIQGLEWVYLPDLPAEEVRDVLGNFDGILMRSKIKMDAGLLLGLPRLKMIARAGAGLDNIDQSVALARGITLMHAGEGNRLAVAEHVVGMLLGLFNCIPQSDAQVRLGIWDREGNRGRQLRGSTVGIIGYGNNGSATAALLSHLGCRVLAYDKYVRGFSGSGILECDLDMLLHEADVVSLHIPLNAETWGWVDSSFLMRCLRKPVLVNAARGEIVVLEDVVAALESGHIWGACLDVLPVEDPQKWDSSLMSRLFARPNVVLTPHTAGWSAESYRAISEVLAEKLTDYFCKNQPGADLRRSNS
jgi:D-3-phosphoglycerate dehydrogenase